MPMKPIMTVGQLKKKLAKIPDNTLVNVQFEFTEGNIGCERRTDRWGWLLRQLVVRDGIVTLLADDRRPWDWAEAEGAT